jgi:hypothetical protein
MNMLSFDTNQETTVVLRGETVGQEHFPVEAGCLRHELIVQYLRSRGSQPGSPSKGGDESARETRSGSLAFVDRIRASMGYMTGLMPSRSRGEHG